MLSVTSTAGPPDGKPEADAIAEPNGGGRTAAPAAHSSFYSRIRDSVWLPVLARIAGIAVGMLALAGIGAASIVAGLDGGRMPDNAPLAADLRSAWLAVSDERPHSLDAGVSLASPAKASGDAGSPAGDSATDQPGSTPDGKVILNTAGIDDLMRLPGIGRRRAEAIIELRTRLKRFRRAQDLLRVRGIGPKSLKRLMPHFVLDPPKHERPDGG
jgi:competence protein ComEA